MVQFSKWNKPIGLWVSVEDGNSWKDWCEDQKFRLEGLKYQYEVTIFSSPNILKLETTDSILQFSKEYFWDPSEWMRTVLVKSGQQVPEIFTPDFEYRPAIRWDLVKEKYQGIIVAPYQCSCRLDLWTQWYYGWDCSSGCIWDLSVIKDFKLIHVDHTIDKNCSENDEPELSHLCVPYHWKNRIRKKMMGPV